MKKLDKLVLGAFLGPFLMTFLVVVFILLTQHMLKYFDDIIGKGLGADVIVPLLFYFAIFMTPVALPLAVLLSSLIAFGNLGEHFELTAIKSSGVSLVRTLRPIFFFVLLLTVVAFYANNNLVPKAALEAYSLLYDIKQKKPALDLREGAFYNGISDISIKVNKKYPDGITLKDVVVYDHRKNDGNKEVTVADSGKMYTILNERYLKFELFDGYNYSEGTASDRDISGQGAPRNSESISRRKFSKTVAVFDLSSFQLERTDKRWFQGNRMMRNLSELNGDIDSVRRQVLAQRLGHYQYKPAYFNYYMRGDSVVLPPDVHKYKLYRDSIAAIPYKEKMDKSPKPQEPEQTSVSTPAPLPSAEQVKPEARKTVRDKDRKPVRRQFNKSLDMKDKAKPQVRRTARKAPTKSAGDKSKVVAAQAQRVPLSPAARDSIFKAKMDSLFTMEPSRNEFQGAASTARQVKSQVVNANSAIENYQKELRTFKIQWHKIIASSFACIAMFLIGAPLGAIIKRGGLGVPFLVSILFFIIYYVLTMQGEKLAKQGTVGVAFGVWMADAILLVAGLFFLRQARADARLFEADFYNVVLDKFKRWAGRRKRVAVSRA